MSEETNSPQPDKPSKTEEAGQQAEVVAAAAAGSEPSSAAAGKAGSEAADSPVSSDNSAADAGKAISDPADKVATDSADKSTSDPADKASALTASVSAADDLGEDAGAMPTGAKFEGDISMRRSPWRSSWAAIKYVHEAGKTDYVQIRTSDRVTVIALLFFCIAEILSIVYTPLSGFRYAFMCCCDVILGSCIIFFLIYRIGILSALNSRQAIITWQMMMGCIFLGIFICLNTIFAIAYLVETFFPHPLL
jgi:hypothetical protein